MQTAATDAITSRKRGTRQEKKKKRARASEPSSLSQKSAPHPSVPFRQTPGSNTSIERYSRCPPAMETPILKLLSPKGSSRALVTGGGAILREVGINSSLALFPDCLIIRSTAHAHDINTVLPTMLGTPRTPAPLKEKNMSALHFVWPFGVAGGCGDHQKRYAVDIRQ